MIDWLTGTVIGKMCATFFISMLPVGELRVGLPYGIALGLEYPLALMAALLTRIPHPFAVLYEPYHALMLLRQLRNAPVLPAVRALGERDREEGTLYCLTLYTYLICHHSLQEKVMTTSR